MSETTPRHYLYGVLILMFFIVGGVTILSEFQAADSGFDLSGRIGEFNRTFDKLVNIEAEVGVLQSSFDAAPEWGLFGALNALIKSSWNALKLMFSSWSFMSGVFDGLNSFFGVPAFIPLIIGLFITITLVFAIYSLIFQKDA